MPKTLKRVNNQPYDLDTKQEALQVYAIHGTYSAVERTLGIPKTTVFSWTKEEWWHEGLAQLRTVKTEEHRQGFSRLIDKAILQAESTLDKASPKDAALIAAMSLDKVRLIDALPTSISSSTGSQGAIQALAQQFSQLSRQWEEKNAKVINHLEQDAKGD